MTKFEKACEMSFNDWIATIPDIVPEAEYTDKHAKWLKKLFNKMRDDRYHVFTTKTIKVLLVAAVLTALLLTAFVIPSSREFIVDNFEIFSTYELTESNNNSVNGEITVGYVPEGFEPVSSVKLGKQIICKYESTNGTYFTVYKYSASMKVEFNTEDNFSEVIIVDGVEYVYCKGNLGVDNVIWTKNDYVYRIDGNITVDELIKIAQTVK